VFEPEPCPTDNAQLIIQIDACARKHYNSLEFKVFFGIQLQ